MALVPLGLVTVKMLPFDNKSEFQVMVDMPEGTTLEAHGARRRGAGRGDAGATEAVVNVQSYVGHVGAVQLQRPGASLLPAPGAEPGRPPGEPRAARASGRRRATTIARRVRDRLLPIAAVVRRHACRWPKCRPARRCCRRSSPKSTDPMPRGGSSSRAQVKAIFEQTPGVVDVDWYVEAPQPKVTLVVDGEKAAAAGLSSSRRGVGGPDGRRRARSPGCCTTRRRAKTCRSSCACRAPTRSLEAIQSLRLSGTRPVAVGELTRAVRAQEEHEPVSQEPAGR